MSTSPSTVVCLSKVSTGWRRLREGAVLPMQGQTAWVRRGRGGCAQVLPLLMALAVVATPGRSLGPCLAARIGPPHRDSRGGCSRDQRGRSTRTPALRLRGGSTPPGFGGVGAQPAHGTLPPAQAGPPDLLSQLSKDTLQAELERRGADPVGAKSVLAIRLNRLMAEGSGGTAGDTMQRQGSGPPGAAGEGEMRDVEMTDSGRPGGMGRRDGRGQRQTSRAEGRGRRGNLGGRDGGRGWEGLKSNNMKVSTTKRTPFISRGVGGRGGSTGNSGTQAAHTGEGDGVGWRGRFLSRRIGARGRGGRGPRGRWRGRGEGRGGWRSGSSERGESPHSQSAAPSAGGWPGEREQGARDGGSAAERGDVSALARDRPQVIQAGAQVGEKFGSSAAAGADVGAVGGGAFGTGGGNAGFHAAGESSRRGQGQGGAGIGGGVGANSGGAFGVLPPLPPLPAAGMGDDSL